MKILSITTSSSICGVAILENTSLIKEISIDKWLTHSEVLMPLIKEIFDETNLNLKDIDLLSVDIGPGSFTGIRIGIATIKAFVDSLNIKSIGVNSLEALSLNVDNHGIICSLIDARKENVYCEIFEKIGNKYLSRRKASFENINELLTELKEINPEYLITFVGDGAVKNKEKILSILPNSQFAYNNRLSPVNVGLCAFNFFNEERETSIEPLYLRKSEAEQKLEEKSNGQQ